MEGVDVDMDPKETENGTRIGAGSIRNFHVQDGDVYGGGTVSDVVGVRGKRNRLKGDGGDGEVRSKRKRTFYVMSKKYADFITHAVVTDKKFKRCDARNSLITAMGLSGKPHPDDFPSYSRVKKRVSYVRGLQKEKSKRTEE